MLCISDDRVFFKLYMEWKENMQEGCSAETAEHYEKLCKKYIVEPLAIIPCRSMNIDHLYGFMKFVLTDGKMKRAEYVVKNRRPVQSMSVVKVIEITDIFNEILEYGAMHGYMDSFFFVLYDKRIEKKLPQDIFTEKLAQDIKEKSGATALSVYGRIWAGEFSLFDKESGRRKSPKEAVGSFYSFKDMVKEAMKKTDMYDLPRIKRKQAPKIAEKSRSI